MPEPAAPTSPIPAFECPVCGGPNNCAVAHSGSFDTPCWCRELIMSPELLARVPEERRGQSCICQHCATHAATSTGEV